MGLTLRIRTLREERGLTLADLAGLVGVSVPHLSELERGKKNLNNRTLNKIAEALRVDPSELIAGDASQKWQALVEDLEKLSPEDQARVQAFAASLRQSQGAE